MILITGAAGQLGTSLSALLPEAKAIDQPDLDLRNTADIARYVRSDPPSILINCAADTAVDRAEEDPGNAWLLNRDAPIAFAEVCAETGTRFVTLSTDYVFDGSKDGAYTESDAPAPQNVYGKSKAAGEEGVLTANPDALIVRTSWLQSSVPPNFIATILRLATSGSARVVDDQVGTPTLAGDLAQGIVRALDTEATGILHLAGPEAMTWHSFAVRVVELAGMSREIIETCTTDEMPRPAKRPLNGMLRSERLDDLLLEPLPPISVGLPSVVSALMSVLSE